MSRYGNKEPKRAMEDMEKEEARFSKNERRERYDEHDEYDEGEIIELDEMALVRFEKQMEEEQSMAGAIFFGLLAIPLGALIWGGIAYATNVKSGLVAIGIGILCGWAVRLGGKGLDRTFGFMGAGFAIASCLLGYIVMFYALVMKQKGLDPSEVLRMVSWSGIEVIFTKAFKPIDWLFLAIAAYEGYQFSFRNVDAELDQFVLQQQRHR